MLEFIQAHQFEVILVLFVLTVFIATGVLPYVYRKSPKQYQATLGYLKASTEIGQSILDAIDKDPTKQNMVEKIFGHATKLVKIAEKLPEFNNLDKEAGNEAKHDYVKNVIIESLRDDGVKVEPDLDKLIDICIKYIVKLSKQG